MTIETTYFSGTPCWTGAQAMVSGPLVWHRAPVGSDAAQNVSPWITVKKNEQELLSLQGIWEHEIEDIRKSTDDLCKIHFDCI